MIRGRKYGRFCAALSGICAVAFVLSACSSGTSGLTTGSFLPGSKPKEAEPTTGRAMNVAATSARASKCGYNFDPVKLRASYIAYESTQGGAEQAGKVEKVYDFTRSSVASKIAAADNYCDEEQTVRIKSDLTRYLAGDFSAPPPKPDTSSDWLYSSSNKPWDPKEALCPNKFCP